MPLGAFKVHGLSTEFLKDKPLFKDIAKGFVDFIGDAPLVIHNASFDMKFINHELKKVGLKEIPMKRAVDTLMIARRKFPGQQNNLDALCKRFRVDSSKRVKHGALLDSELLADVYIELLGGRQIGFGLDGKADIQKDNKKNTPDTPKPTRKKKSPYLVPRPKEESKEAVNSPSGDNKTSMASPPSLKLRKLSLSESDLSRHKDAISSITQSFWKK